MVATINEIGKDRDLIGSDKFKEIGITQSEIFYDVFLVEYGILTVCFSSIEITVIPQKCKVKQCNIWRNNDTVYPC